MYQIDTWTPRDCPKGPRSHLEFFGKIQSLFGGVHNKDYIVLGKMSGGPPIFPNAIQYMHFPQSKDMAASSRPSNYHVSTFGLQFL